MKRKASQFDGDILCDTDVYITTNDLAHLDKEELKRLKEYVDKEWNQRHMYTYIYMYFEYEPILIRIKEDTKDEDRGDDLTEFLNRIYGAKNVYQHRFRSFVKDIIAEIYEETECSLFSYTWKTKYSIMKPTSVLRKEADENMHNLIDYYFTDLLSSK